MGKYLFQTSYGPESVAGLMKQGGASRRDAVHGLIEAVGGTV